MNILIEQELILRQKNVLITKYFEVVFFYFFCRFRGETLAKKSNEKLGAKAFLELYIGAIHDM